MIDFHSYHWGGQKSTLPETLNNDCLPEMAIKYNSTPKVLFDLEALKGAVADTFPGSEHLDIFTQILEVSRKEIFRIPQVLAQGPSNSTDPSLDKTYLTVFKEYETLLSFVQSIQKAAYTRLIPVLGSKGIGALSRARAS
jgi:hypothetical protein